MKHRTWACNRNTPISATHVSLEFDGGNSYSVLIFGKFPPCLCLIKFVGTRADFAFSRCTYPTVAASLKLSIPSGSNESMCFIIRSKRSLLPRCHFVLQRNTIVYDKIRRAICNFSRYDVNEMPPNGDQHFPTLSTVSRWNVG